MYTLPLPTGRRSIDCPSVSECPSSPQSPTATLLHSRNNFRLVLVGNVRALSSHSSRPSPCACDQPGVFHCPQPPRSRPHSPGPVPATPSHPIRAELGPSYPRVTHRGPAWTTGKATRDAVGQSSLASGTWFASAGRHTVAFGVQTGTRLPFALEGQFEFTLPLIVSLQLAISLP